MQSKVSAATESACGVGGTVFSTFCVFPIDLVKTRIIIDSSLANKGIFSSIVEMARKEGLASLWRGVDIELIKAIASNSIYSYVYAYLKNIIIATALKQQALPDKQTLSSSKSLASLMINPDTKVSLAKDGPAGTNYAPMPVKPQSLGVMANLIIGCIAGSVTQGFVNPLNVVCTRMQVQRGKSKSDGMIETFQKLYAEGGIEAMYRGFVPSLVLSLNPSIQYMVFDQLKLFWLRRKQNANVEGFKNTKDVGLSPLESLIIGGLAKAAATYATYPLIVAKVRMQASKESDGMIAILLKLWKKEGLAGLYAGVSAQIVKSVLASALMFMIKEQLMNLALALMPPPVDANKTDKTEPTKSQ